MKINVMLNLLILLILVGCGNQLWPAEEGFPDREIVFEPKEILEYGYLGFIHPDGTGFITRTVATGSTEAGWPAWSSDGRFISYQTVSASNSQRVVSQEGRLLGECQGWLWNDHRNWVTKEGYLLFISYNPSIERDRIVLGDFNTCKIKEILFEIGKDVNAYFDGAHLSSQGILAMSQIFYNSESLQDAKIVIMDIASKETKIIANGRGPAWSADGEWLAYTALDGIYIVRKDGTDTRKVIEIDSSKEGNDNADLVWFEGFPTPSWSPDGKWITYHRMTDQGPIIYKVEVETGIETKIFEGGVYPNWRWDTFDE